MRAQLRSECPGACKPAVEGACGAHAGGRCRFVFKCTRRDRDRRCGCDITAACNKREEEEEGDAEKEEESG